jgi:hypothetical protein
MVPVCCARVANTAPTLWDATCTSTLLTHALEVCGVWAASYFLVADSALSLVRGGWRALPPLPHTHLASLSRAPHAPPPPVSLARAPPQLDLTAYTGYVYVPLVANSLTGLLLGSIGLLADALHLPQTRLPPPLRFGHHGAGACVSHHPPSHFGGTAAAACSASAAEGRSSSRRPTRSASRGGTSRPRS